MVTGEAMMVGGRRRAGGHSNRNSGDIMCFWQC